MSCDWIYLTNQCFRRVCDMDAAGVFCHFDQAPALIPSGKSSSSLTGLECLYEYLNSCHYSFTPTDMSGFVVFALVLSLSSAMVPCLGFPPSVTAGAAALSGAVSVGGSHRWVWSRQGRNTRAAVSYDAQNQRIRVRSRRQDTHLVRSTNSSNAMKQILICILITAEMCLSYFLNI